MKKKLLSLILVTLLASSTLTACGGSKSSSEESSSSKAENSKVETSETESSKAADPYVVTMAYIGNEQKDIEKVETKINEILSADLNTTIDIMALGFGTYQQQLQLMLSGGEKLDIVPIFLANANSYVSSGQVIDMTELIDKYGKNIKEKLGEDAAKVSNVNGYVFGVPVQKEWFTDSALLMRKDIVDKYKIDVSKITSLAAAEEAFAAVHAGEPDMNILVGAKATGVLGQIKFYDALLDGFGVLEDGGQTSKVTNLYESKTYMDLAKTLYNYNQKGYVYKDMATSTETSAALIKAGNSFAYTSAYKPGVIEQDSLSTGYQLVAAKIQPCETYCTMNAASFVSWGISQNAEKPERVMQLLDYLYGSKEVMDLLNWGIEGEHYVYTDKEKDLIGFPEGIDSSNSQYSLNIGWELPNQFSMHIWKTNLPTVWKDIEEINNNSMRSKAFGFVYDFTSLSNEITALNNVWSEYSNAVNSGSVNPDEALPKLNKALYDAGLQTVIDEKQKQLDAWSASKK